MVKNTILYNPKLSAQKIKQAAMKLIPSGLFV